eukprot:SAG11_NODE_12410_length_705_cov_0.900990_1_plen_159_part_00
MLQREIATLPKAQLMERRKPDLVCGVHERSLPPLEVSGEPEPEPAPLVEPEPEPLVDAVNTAVDTIDTAVDAAVDVAVDAAETDAPAGAVPGAELGKLYFVRDDHTETEQQRRLAADLPRYALATAEGMVSLLAQRSRRSVRRLCAPAAASMRPKRAA